MSVRGLQIETQFLKYFDRGWEGTSPRGTGDGRFRSRRRRGLVDLASAWDLQRRVREKPAGRRSGSVMWN